MESERILIKYILRPKTDALRLTLGMGSGIIGVACEETRSSRRSDSSFELR
jgi:hypothetical protein